MGLLDGIFGGGDDVKPELIGISPEADRKFKTLENAADKSTASFGESANRGVGGKVSAQNEKALYGYEPGMSKAISARYSGLLGQDLERIKSQGKIAAYQDKAKAGESAQMVRDARTKIDLENKQKILQANIANEQARSSVLSSVLGLAGAAVGFALGGPAGAVVGSGAGSSLAGSPKNRQMPEA